MAVKVKEEVYVGSDMPQFMDDTDNDSDTMQYCSDTIQSETETWLAFKKIPNVRDKWLMYHLENYYRVFFGKF